MFNVKTLLVLIPALPLAAAVLTAILGKRVLRERSHWPTVAALLLSFLGQHRAGVPVAEANRPAGGRQPGRGGHAVELVRHSR